MSINCDICQLDVTPKNKQEPEMYSMVDLIGEKICVCLGCEKALYEFRHTGKWKKESERLKKEEEME